MSRCLQEPKAAGSDQNRGMTRVGDIGALFLAVALLGSGCGSGGGAGADLELVTSGTLTVCTDSPYVPMTFERDGEYTGFDIDLMQAIADDLGLKLAVDDTGLDAITSGLAMEAGRCDIAAAAVPISSNWEENITYSQAYFRAGEALLVSRGSGITDLAALAGRNLGVQSGTDGEAYANDHDPGASIVVFESAGELYDALADGTVDGVLVHILSAAERALNDDMVELVATFPTGVEYGLATKKKGAEDVLRAVEDSLDKLRDDGTLDKIYEDWF